MKLTQIKNSKTVSNKLFMSKLISLIKCLTCSCYKVPIEQRTNIYFPYLAQGPEELHLYARIILRTSYLVKYITSSF